MENFTTFCLHQILGVLYSVSEYTIIAIETIAIILFAIGLYKASLFLADTLASTNRLIRLLDSNATVVKLSDILDSPAIQGTARIISDPVHQAAFTIGWLKPQVCLTSGLVNDVDKKSLDIIVRHELGHARRRDPLFHMLLSLFSETLWFVPLVNDLSRRHKLLSEISCDNLAVTAGHDRIDVARTLTDLAANPLWVIPSRKPAFSSICDHLEIRVLALLGNNPACYLRPTAKVAVASFLIVASIFLSSSTLLAARYDPSGDFADIRTTAGFCENGHKDIGFLEKHGIICPHCGSGIYTDPPDSPPTCHETH